MRWLLFFVGIAIVFILISSKEDYDITFHNKFGTGYGTNFLYAPTPNNFVVMPSDYDEVMNACKRGCFNHVRYRQPNNFFHTHEAQQTEDAWCLQSCAVTASKPYFGVPI